MLSDGFLSDGSGSISWKDSQECNQIIDPALNTQIKIPKHQRRKRKRVKNISNLNVTSISTINADNEIVISPFSNKITSKKSSPILKSTSPNLENVCPGQTNIAPKQNIPQCQLSPVLKLKNARPIFEPTSPILNSLLQRNTDSVENKCKPVQYLFTTALSPEPRIASLLSPEKQSNVEKYTCNKSRATSPVLITNNIISPFHIRRPKLHINPYITVEDKQIQLRLGKVPEDSFTNDSSIPPKTITCDKNIFQPTHQIYEKMFLDHTSYENNSDASVLGNQFRKHSVPISPPPFTKQLNPESKTPPLNLYPRNNVDNLANNTANYFQNKKIITHISNNIKTNDEEEMFSKIIQIQMCNVQTSVRDTVSTLNTDIVRTKNRKSSPTIATNIKLAKKQSVRENDTGDEQHKLFKTNEIDTFNNIRIDDKLIDKNKSNGRSLSPVLSSKRPLPDLISPPDDRIVKKIKNYFDSNFSSDSNTQVSINESSQHSDVMNDKKGTPIDITESNSPIASQVSEVKIYTDISSSSKYSQNSKTPVIIKNEIEENIPKRRKRYKKDGLAQRLQTLIKNQRNQLYLWRHELYLANNSKLVPTTNQFRCFGIVKILPEYGNYIVEAVDIKDHREWTIILNNNFECNIAVSEKSFLKVYEPFQTIETECGVVMFNVCKFECINVKEDIK